MQINFEKISRQADITKVISEFIKVTRKGKSYVAICPFHDDHSPSLNIEPTKQIYKCFSCGAGGGAIKFVKEYNKCSYLDAAKKVIEICDIPDSGDLISNQNNSTMNKQSDRNDALFNINNDVCDFYHYSLKNTEEGKKHLKDLLDRKVSEEQVQKYKIGYASKSPNDLTTFLFNKGYSKSDVLKSGLTIVNKKGELVDFFWNRLVYPILNTNNKVSGFIGRVVKDNNSSTKYLSLADNEVYKKSQALFNIKEALSSRTNDIYVVEGIHDALRLDFLGIKNVVAIFGTLLSPFQLNVLKRFKRVILLLDSDSAGQSATNLIKNKLLDQGLAVLKLTTKISSDPDEFFKKYNKEEAKKILANTIEISFSRKVKPSIANEKVDEVFNKNFLLPVEKDILLCILKSPDLIRDFLMSSNAWMISDIAKELSDYLSILFEVMHSNIENKIAIINRTRKLLSQKARSALLDLEEEFKVSKEVFTTKVFYDSIKILRKMNKKALRESNTKKTTQVSK